MDNQNAVRFAHGDDLQLGASVIESDPGVDVADNHRFVVADDVPSMGPADSVLPRSPRPLERQCLHTLNFG